MKRQVALVRDHAGERDVELSMFLDCVLTDDRERTIAEMAKADPALLRDSAYRGIGTLAQIREHIRMLRSEVGVTYFCLRGPDVEKGGQTADGKAFHDIDDYKKILLADHKDQIARNLTQMLLVYATGAEIQFADREIVEQIVAKLKATNYGFRTLVHEVVESRVFLNK